ncbi:MAG: hypothetical protein AAF654_03170 [Myxococcota bacterium]
MNPFVLTFALLAAGSPEYGPQFWNHWGDGQAEVAGYDLVYNRYGEVRTGVAVNVFVSETFSSSARVKADPGVHPKNDEYPVLKQNLVQDFPTGLYDYNLMTSAFLQLTPRHGRPAGTLTKASFSAQEWCGHAYAQMLFDADAVHLTSHSYFDREGDEKKSLPYPKDAISSEALMFWARGLAGPALRDGESVTVPFLPSLERARLDHRPVAWSTVTLKRGTRKESVRVPAGNFEVLTHTAEVANGLVYTFRVEAEFPHRVVTWGSNRGDEARLRGVKRMKYWQLSRPGGEKLLAEIGLKPRPALAP